MSSSDVRADERTRHLMMAALDNELPHADAVELDRLLADANG